MVPMDMTASTTVVVTVGMTLHVTNKLVTVTWDVTRVILLVTAGMVSFLFNSMHIIVINIYFLLIFFSLSVL